MLSRPSPHSRLKADWVGLDRFSEMRLLVALPGWRQHLWGNLGPQRVQRSAKRPTQRIVSTKEEKQGCTPGGRQRQNGGRGNFGPNGSDEQPFSTQNSSMRNEELIHCIRFSGRTTHRKHSRNAQTGELWNWKTCRP